jgi:hypothetical protein
MQYSARYSQSIYVRHHAVFWLSSFAFRASTNTNTNSHTFISA